MKKLILFIFLFVISFNTQSANTRPEDIVKQFYDWRFKEKFTGVPEATTLRTGNRFLSQSLICLLDHARDYRNRFAQKFPTDKPPFIEGDIFTSLFEGANRYKLESTRIANQVATIQLHFYYDLGDQTDKTGWRDSVLLQQKNHQWRIVDIHYGGEFEFGNSGNLRQNLIDELSKDNQELHWKGKVQLKLCHSL